MITLDDFETNTKHRKAKKAYKIFNVTRREWSIEDLPYTVRKDPKAFVKKCSSLNFSEDINKLIDLIEHGSADLKKNIGSKKVVVAKGIEPYDPYLLWNLYNIYKRYKAGLKQVNLVGFDKNEQSVRSDERK